MKDVTLGEGNTPLVESLSVGPALGLGRLLFKLENCNPSGSYKDRFVACETSAMLRRGIKACVATSSGNTGASLAAYCARYKIACAIVVGENVAVGKLEQMRAHGARIIQIKGFITQPSVTARVYQILESLSRSGNIHLVVSAYRICPEGMTGVESLSSELDQQCPDGIDHVFVPVGGGGLFAALCRGFASTARHPCIHAVQPNNCSTVVAAFLSGDDVIRPVESSTRISGLSVPFDLDASLALRLLHQHGGTGISVADENVFQAQRKLLAQEGIYCEPAGATAFAGLETALREGRVKRNDTIVCLVTGSGFKDPDSIREAAKVFEPVIVEHEKLKECVQEAIGSCE